MVAFPLGKFIYLGIKQLSGPIAGQLKTAAKRSQFISKYVCSPPAQALHKLEMFVKFRLMGAKGKVEYSRLNDEKSAEVGAEMLGEAFLYGVAASYMLYEYVKSVKKGIEKETNTNDSIADLQKQMGLLTSQVERLSAIAEKLESVQPPISSSGNKLKK